MPAQDHAPIELPPDSTADVSFVDGQVVVHLRVACDVGLDEVSRYSIEHYVSDAAFNVAYVVHVCRKEAAEALTVLLYSTDEPSPIAERLPRPQAEELFAETREHGERWPAIVAAELVGASGDVLDRW